MSASANHRVRLGQTARRSWLTRHGGREKLSVNFTFYGGSTSNRQTVISDDAGDYQNFFTGLRRLEERLCMNGISDVKRVRTAVFFWVRTDLVKLQQPWRYDIASLRVQCRRGGIRDLNSAPRASSDHWF